MSAQTIRRRLRLRRLSPALRAAFEQGEITTSVAEAAARLTAEQQAQLEHTLADGGQVTLAAVREIARARTSEAALTLPDELFAEPTTSWQLNVRGHLQAALEAIPADQRDSPLAEAITAALKAAERPDHAAAETPAQTQRAR